MYEIYINLEKNILPILGLRTMATLEILSMLSHSVVSNSVIPWTVGHHAPLSVKFSRQEYWSGLPFSSQGSSVPRD